MGRYYVNTNGCSSESHVVRRKHWLNHTKGIEKALKRVRSQPGRSIVIGLLCLTLVACGDVHRGCPRGLSGGVHPEGFWAAFSHPGTDNPTTSMTLEAVAVECIPYAQRSSAADSEETTRSAIRIAATAEVSYEIHDLEWFTSRNFPPRGLVRFEALSSQGVVLAETEASFQLRETGRRETVSASLDHLEPEVAARIERIVARWVYGR